jgi:DNA-binding response OmpR family regulator
MWEDSTGAMLAKFVRVLMVHDARYELDAFYDALRKEFIVRGATSIADASEVARTTPLACIVCVAGGEIAARELYEACEREVTEHAKRFVFLRTPDATDEDNVFLLTSGRTWLPMPLPPNELLAVVRATSAA